MDVAIGTDVVVGALVDANVKMLLVDEELDGVE